MPVRTGSNSRLQAAWSASPTVWTMAGWFRLNSVNGMMMFRSKAAAVGSIGAFAENNGTTLTNYTQTSAGGSSDQIPGDQSLYNTGAALVPLMMTRNGNVVTVFNPNYPSGRFLNIATAGAIMSEVAAADTLAFGAWVQQGTVTLPIDQDCDELSAWTLAASATEYAAFAAATKPEDIGDATFKASMFDVWTLNPGGAGGNAIADGTTFTGLKNSNVLTLIGTTATVSSRAAPVARGTNATAGGVTLTATSSLITGSASAGSGSSASGVTFTASSSLIPGGALGNGGATLNFQAAGEEFGKRTGLGISTFSLDVGSAYRVEVFADALTLGSPILTTGSLTTDSAGKLPNVTNALLFSGTAYAVVCTRQSDKARVISTMVAA